jgi:hypothetical protein
VTPGGCSVDSFGRQHKSEAMSEDLKELTRERIERHCEFMILWESKRVPGAYKRL